MDTLKAYRERASMTQEELATKSGVSRVTISMIENGKQTVVKSSTLVKLADALNVQPQVLLCPES